MQPSENQIGINNTNFFTFDKVFCGVTQRGRSRARWASVLAVSCGVPPRD